MKKNFPVFSIFFLFILLAGCASPVPFREPAFKPLTSSADAEKKLFDMQSAIPYVTGAECGIVLERHGTRTTLYAALKVNCRTGIVSFVAMTPSGMKLLEASGTASKLQYLCRFPETALLKFEESDVQTMLAALSAVFLEPVPPSKTPVTLKKGKWVLQVGKPDGTTLHYTFAGTPPLLYEKECTKDGKTRWSMKSYSAMPFKNIILPANLIFEDHTNDFRMFIRIRRFQELP